MPSQGQRLLGWAMLITSILGLMTTWALATARYGGPDEPAHVLRAASVARGQLLGAPVAGLADGFRAVTVPAALATGDPRCFRHDRRLPATCAVADPGVTGTRVAATSTGTYPPWYDALVGIPTRLVGGAAHVISYRLVAAVWCALVFGLGLIRIRGPDRAAVLLAVSPAMWFLFGVVNPNSLEIALCLLAWVGVERIRTSPAPTIAEMWWIGAPLAVAVAIRPIAIVAAGTVALAVVVLTHRTRLLRRAHWLTLTLAPAVAVVASVAWSAWSRTSVYDAREASARSLLGRVVESATGTGDTLRELAGSMGWLEFSAPWPAQALWWAAALGSGVAAWRRGGRLRTVWVATAGSVLLVPIVFESVLAGRIGFIWQGRYSIPTASGLIVVGSTDWLSTVLRSWRRRLVLGAIGVAELLTFWGVLRRYTVGADGSWLFRHGAWQPPMPPFVLLLANVSLMSWLIISCNSVPVTVGQPSPRPGAPPLR